MNKEEFFKKIEAIALFFEKVAAHIAIITGFAMVFVVIYGVFFRYVLNNPPRWSEELARYLMIWMALLSSSVCQQRKEHVRITFLIERFPKILQRIIVFFTQVFIFYFFYIMFSYGILMVRGAKYQISTSMEISMQWPLLIIPIAALMNMVQIFLQIILEFKPNGYGLKNEKLKKLRAKG